MDDQQRRRPHTERSPDFAAVDPAMGADERQRAPSAERTVVPIAQVLARYLPAAGTALEVASGTGQHVVTFAANHPGITWLPSDPSPDARRSIAAWVRAGGHANVLPPRDLDLTHTGWQEAVPDGLVAILASNLLHISPWAATLGLLQGAAERLASEGHLFIYGCLRIHGRHLTESNAAFDASLRARDPRWGVRDLDDVTDAASAAGLALKEVVPMPADNRLLVLALAD
ncbi:DUF938 domain-containing protein [Spiribacter halobius]|nr:DUF938 domain-containing protein [Spiribacter halobius]UEX76435.1 class I SAM-dependent methyltransferase [Spiribacter halobius]